LYFNVWYWYLFSLSLSLYLKESRQYVSTPDEFGMHLYENLTLKTKDDIKLHAYLIKQEGEYSKKAPTVIFLQVWLFFFFQFIYYLFILLWQKKLTFISISFQLNSKANAGNMVSFIFILELKKIDFKLINLFNSN